MTLREFYDAILLFLNDNQYLFCIFNQNYSAKKVFEHVINRYITWDFGHCPRPLSALELTLSGLILGSRVDTAGDNGSPNVISLIIANHAYMRKATNKGVDYVNIAPKIFP